MLINLIWLICGFIFLVRGADYFIDGAAALAGRARMSAMMVGLTVVAMGTSLPELAICITSALNDTSAIAVGNVIGSNVGNVLFILGVLSLMMPLTVRRRTISYEAPFTLCVIALLYYIVLHYGVLSRMWAGVLLGLFACYLVYLFLMAHYNPQKPDKIKNISITKIVLYIVLGLIAIIMGSDLIVKSATSIAEHIGVSNRIIGLTIVALGTSLPELVTGIVALRKNQPDIAVGNIVGSSIFNMLFVLGVGGMVAPLHFEKMFLFDLVISAVAISMLILSSFQTMRLSRLSGVLFLMIYALYILHII